MSEMLRQLCGLSLFCGIALGLMPEGGVKKAASIACTVVLTFRYIKLFAKIAKGIASKVIIMTSSTK